MRVSGLLFLGLSCVVVSSLQLAPASGFSISDLEASNKELMAAASRLSPSLLQNAIQSPQAFSSPDQALTIQVSSPTSLYVGGDGDVKQYNASTGTFLGNFGTSIFSSPDLTYGGPDNHFFIIDGFSSNVLEYDQAGVFVRVLTGPANGLELNQPIGVTFSPYNGNLFVSDIGNASNGVFGNIREINPTTGDLINTLTNGPKGFQPLQVAFANNSLYVSDLTSNSVLRYNPSTNVFDTFASSSELTSPGGLAFGGSSLNNDLFVVGSASTILRYDGATGAFKSIFATSTLQNTTLTDLAFGPDGNLYVTDTRNSSILKFDGITGAFEGQFVTQQDGNLTNPTGILFAPSLVPEPVIGGSAFGFGVLGLLAIKARRRRQVGSSK
ncbi:haloacid dehalogenase [Gloeobacter kilaueensis JS1]|uniref:Haloacid dehalogenase n=2 Tax=Gloeobacter TaxID=33071 RepID=U5QP84_GLOK1|nr:haloacid dehalogenase [Gloeobacter kilaueensis JS1]